MILLKYKHGCIDLTSSLKSFSSSPLFKKKKKMSKPINTVYKAMYPLVGAYHSNCIFYKLTLDGGSVLCCLKPLQVPGLSIFSHWKAAGWQLTAKPFFQICLLSRLLLHPWFIQDQWKIQRLFPCFNLWQVYLFIYLLPFCPFRATPTAYGGS